MKWRILLLAALAAGAATASAADTMRCGRRIVREGDPRAKVAELCGEPTSAETRTVYLAGLPRLYFSTDDVGADPVSEREILIPNRAVVPVVIDVWLYNQGSHRLMREVVFRDNRVVAINVLGRGY